MEVVTVDSCPCCGSSDMHWPLQRSEEIVEGFRLLSRMKYGGCMDGWEDRLTLAMARCKRCGHLWHHTRPDQASLFEMYAHGRRLKGGSASTTPSSRMLSSMRGLFRYCSSPNGNKSLLDFGSGAGRWSIAAHQAGFHVTAYEPSSSRQEKIGGIEVVGTLSAIEGRLFDAINLEQVLEHVPDPKAELRALKPFCHPDTVLRISVPDVERLGDKLWQGFPFDGKAMHILSPYEHLHGFKRSSLKALLREAGLRECTDWRLAFNLPCYALERYAIKLGFPFGRTTTLVRFDFEDEVPKEPSL